MEEEIKKIVQENLELTKEIHTMTKKIKRHITFQKIVSIIYILLFVVPIILSIVYLPPLLGNVFDQYKELLGADSVVNDLNKSGIDFNKISPDILNRLK